MRIISKLIFCIRFSRGLFKPFTLVTKEISHCCVILGWLQVFTDQVTTTLSDTRHGIFSVQEIDEVGTVLMLQMTKLGLQEVRSQRSHKKQNPLFKFKSDAQGRGLVNHDARVLSLPVRSLIPERQASTTTEQQEQVH